MKSALQSITFKSARNVFVGLACLLLIACDGFEGTFVAGIEGTGITSGFGSVFVNGREFATDDAEIVFNGNQVNESFLRVGDVLSVSGTVDSDGNAQAQRIEFVRVVDGPVQAMSLLNGVGTVTTLGQVVEINESTNFINTTADDLAMNDLIAVSGQIGPNGVLHATSLEESTVAYNAGVTRIEADGLVSNLDTGANTLNIGVLQVEFDAVSVNTEEGPLENGAFIEVFGTQSGTGAPLVADAVSVVNRSVGQPGGRVQTDSIITDFNSLGDFMLNGQPVNAANATRTDMVNLAPNNGVRVEVEGELRSGVIIVERLAVRPPASIRLNAVVDNVTTTGLELLGVSAQAQPTTQYLDASTANLRTFRLDALSVGDFVSAQGFRNTTGQFVLTRLERRNASNQTLARGHVDSFDQAVGSIIVRGVTVRTDANTQFSNAQGESVDANSFYTDLNENDPVVAIGPENANEINAADTVQSLATN